MRSAEELLEVFAQAEAFPMTERNTCAWCGAFASRREGLFSETCTAGCYTADHLPHCPVREANMRSLQCAPL